MDKRGQEVMGISFGALISIIIIIAIVAVSFYAINHFLRLNKCSQVSLFYQDMKDEVSDAWTHGNYRGVFEGKLPSSGILSAGIEEVCFGNLTTSATTYLYSQRKQLFIDSGAQPNHNIFAYPPENACSGKFYSYELRCNDSPCTNFPEFFCVNVTNGKVSINITKTSTERAVTINP